MNRFESPKLFILGGVSGVVGTVSYIVAITASLPWNVSFLLVIAWPVLSIIFAYALLHYIRLEKDSPAIQLSFLMACLGFTLLAAMASAQLAVHSGIDTITADVAHTGDTTVDLIRGSMRLIDMGIDVAWDVFIGTSLIFMAFALKGHSKFGKWWGLSAGLLGIALMIFNVVTFPWPPATKGLFDIGPFVGLFIIILASRLIALGRTMRLRDAGNA